LIVVASVAGSTCESTRCKKEIIGFQKGVPRVKVKPQPSGELDEAAATFRR